MLKPPLAALGIPDEALNDREVEDLFQKLYGDTMVFIMAHELGHLFHKHSANVSMERSRQQESEADAFAVELMARLHAPQSEGDLAPTSAHYRRLAYDELLAQQLAMAQRKAERRREPAARVAACTR